MLFPNKERINFNLKRFRDMIFPIKIFFFALYLCLIVKSSDDRISLPWLYDKNMSNDDYKVYLRDTLSKCRLSVERMDEALKKDPQVCKSIANYYCNKYHKYYPDRCKELYKFDHLDKITSETTPSTVTNSRTLNTQTNTVLINPSEIYRIITTNSLTDIIKNVEYIRKIGSYCLARENDYQCVQILDGLKSRSKVCKVQKDLNDCKLLATNLCTAFPDIKICENQSKKLVRRSVKNRRKKLKNRTTSTTTGTSVTPTTMSTTTIPFTDVIIEIPTTVSSSTKKAKSGKNWKSFFMKKAKKI